MSCLFECGGPRMQRDGSAIWLHLHPKGPVACAVRPIDMRQVATGGLEPEPLARVTEQFEASVIASKQNTAAQRRARLASAPKLPRRIETTTTVFERNPDVVAEVLERAAGNCEACLKHAPFFRRSDGSAYLEVHHRTPLARGGEDTVANAIALCPNCHRAAHHG